jgi:hypothetical protein
VHNNGRSVLDGSIPRGIFIALTPIDVDG